MRLSRLSPGLALALGLALAGCHADPQPMHPKPGDLPPLPPASGTPVGYLIDASTELSLRADQVDKLKAIDSSLAASDADIDTQLRQIEHPTEDEQLSPQEIKAGKKRARHNHAPGASVVSNSDAGKLHALRDTNDRKAIEQAWAILDDSQRPGAQHILEERGVAVPGKKGPTPTPGSGEDGEPMPGAEP